MKCTWYLHSFPIPFPHFWLLALNPRTLDNLNFFQVSWKVRVIGCQLYFKTQWNLSKLEGYPVCYIQILLVVVFSFSQGHVNILTLSSWHFYFVPLSADGLYSAVSTQLVKRSQKMMEKYRQLLFDESMVSIFVYFKAYTATCIFFFSCFKPCEMVHIVQEWSWGFIT